MCTAIEFRAKTMQCMDEQMKNARLDNKSAEVITSQPQGIGNITNLNKYVFLSGNFCVFSFHNLSRRWTVHRRIFTNWWYSGKFWGIFQQPSSDEYVHKTGENETSKSVFFNLLTKCTEISYGFTSEVIDCWTVHFYHDLPEQLSILSFISANQSVDHTWLVTSN